MVNGQIASSLPTRNEFKSTKSISYELGYKGVFGSNLSVNLDVYYNKRIDLLFTGQASPLVLYPTLGSDVADGFIAASDPAVLMTLGSSQAELAAMLSGVASGLAENPLGLVESDIVPDSTLPVYLVSRYNAGEIDYYGFDFGLTYYLNDDFSIFSNFSWLSKNVWDDEELGNQGTGQIYNLNIADKKLRLGFDYIPEKKGFNYNAALRYQSDVEVEEGTIYVGLVEAFTVVDAGVGYNFGNGVHVNLTGQNIFNTEYRIPDMAKDAENGFFISCKCKGRFISHLDFRP